jgi:flagellar hook-associated protein 2
MTTISTNVSPSTGTTSTGTTSTGTTSTGSTSTGSTNLASTISAAGIGSGLDVTAIVTALVNARKAASQSQIDTKTAAATAQLTGYAALKSALAGVSTALATLTTDSTYGSYAATLGDSSIGTTSTLTSAVPGQYAVNVTQLATAQKRTSAVYDGKAAIGAGTLTVGIGTASMNIPVSATATMADIAAAINKSADNPGVTATVVNGSGGSQLLLSSNKTGVANGYTVSSSSDSSSGLATFATALNTAGSTDAKDAQLTIDGIPASSASNNVSGVLDGVTLNLAKTGSTTLTVTQDTSKISDAITGLVTAYNTYNTTVTALDAYNTSTGTTGALLGDPVLNSVKRAMSSLMGGAVAGNAFGTLANLGITRAADGSMSVDSAKLGSALATDPTSVKNLFSGTNGIATKLQTAVTGFVSNSGTIATKVASLNASLTRIDTQQTALDARMAVYQKMLNTQYTKLDSLVTTLNSTSSYLTSSLKALEATYTKSD